MSLADERRALRWPGAAMICPVILFVASLGVLGLSLGGWVWQDFGLIAFPSALASLYLMLRALDPWRRAGFPVIIDGSNVIYWAGDEPDLKTVRDLLRLVGRKRWKPGVIFDANVGYKLSDRYLDDADLARALKLPADRVLVVPKGTPADQFILEAARDLGARVVTNDRYRDWADRFPEVRRPGFLITGDVRRGKVRIDMGKG